MSLGVAPATPDELDPGTGPSGRPVVLTLPEQEIWASRLGVPATVLIAGAILLLLLLNGKD